MTAKKPPPSPDARCPYCHGKGWVQGAVGWPTECRCIVRQLNAAAKAAKSTRPEPSR